MSSARTNRTRARVVAAATSVVVATAAFASTRALASARTATPTTVLPAPTPGAAALRALSPTQVAAVARSNQQTTAQLTDTLAHDATAYLGRDGRLFFQDPKAPAHAARPAPRGPFPNSQTFLLHSRPGAHRVNFLKFDGYSLPAGTNWNNGNAYNALPFDLDGNPGTFNQAEIDEIQSIWQRMSEDYAALDIDVTTQPPAAAAIDRTDAADDMFGGATVFTNSPNGDFCGAGGCGGLSFVGTIDDIGASHNNHQPSWVFADGLAGGDTKDMAEAGAHEFGHEVGLSHDGKGAQGYYFGHGMWAPIMGAGYDRPVSQWSKGEYATPTNTEDDFAVMGTNNVNEIADETGGGTSPTATLVPDANNLIGKNVIGGTVDADSWKYTAPCSGSFSFAANPAAVSPDLSIDFSLWNFGGAFIANDIGQPVMVDRDTTTGMGGTITQTLTAGSDYALVVQPLPQGTADTGWTNYGNVGNYSVHVTTPAGCGGGAPPNDNFASAQLVTGNSGTATGTNVGATKQTGEPNAAANTGGHSIWYSYTPTVSGSLTIDTCGSPYDTTLGVYTGTAVNALTSIAQDDDTCGSNTSRVTFNATSGTAYKIQVDGFNGATGSVTLHWALSVANDNFANAQVLSAQTGTLTTDTSLATKEAGEPNPNGNIGGKSVWYRFTATKTSPFVLDTCNSGFDTLINVYTGSTLAGLTSVGSNDDSPCGNQSILVVNATAGTTYSIQIDGYNPGAGAASGALTFTWLLGKRVTVPYSATEFTRLQQIATFLGTTPAALQHDGPAFLSFLENLSGDHTVTPWTTGPPRGSGNNVIATWTADDIPLLTQADTKFAVDDIDASRLSFYFVSFLLALGGH